MSHTILCRRAARRKLEQIYLFERELLVR